MQEFFLNYFQQITIVQVLDICLVVLVLFFLFRSLKGSIAFNIFLGALIIYGLWAIVLRLDMPLMSEIMNRLVSIGMIGLIVLFQPEIRKFLVNIGRRSWLGKNGALATFLQSKSLKKYIMEEEVIHSIMTALKNMAKENLGATLVVSRANKFQIDTNTGIMINGLVSAPLLESIFAKTSILHDGAVLIDQEHIVAAKVILPVSNDLSLPHNLGLRHRSAVGASVDNEVIVIVLSEERKTLSLAKEGVLHIDVSPEEIKKELYKAFMGNMG